MSNGSDPAIAIDFNSDSEDIFQDAVSYIQIRYPDWEPADANLETWLLAATARIASEQGDLGTGISMAIFKTFGTTVAGVAAAEAVSADGLADFTLVDAMGYTIPAGTQIAMRDATGNLQAFETASDTVVAPGSTTATGVYVRAIIAGIEGNGLSGSAQLVTAISFIESVVVTAPTANGADAEDDNTYLARLASELQLQTPRPIIPRDFEVLVKANFPSVERVIALDGWKPSDSTLNNERYIGLAMTDAAGEDVPSGTKTDVVAFLDALRELNFVVAAGAPTYTTIKVTADVITYPNFDPVEVKAAVEDALTDYLSPVKWGAPKFGEDDTAWLNATKVRYKEVSGIIDRVVGVDYVNSLSIATQAGTLGTADVTLSGVVPLTRVGTLTITAENP